MRENNHKDIFQKLSYNLKDFFKDYLKKFYKEFFDKYRSYFCGFSKKMLKDYPSRVWRTFFEDD